MELWCKSKTWTNTVLTSAFERAASVSLNTSGRAEASFPPGHMKQFHAVDCTSSRSY